MLYYCCTVLCLCCTILRWLHYCCTLLCYAVLKLLYCVIPRCCYNVLPCTMLCCILLHYTVVTMWYCTVPSVLYYAVPRFFVVLYCDMLRYVVLEMLVLYYVIIECCTALGSSPLLLKSVLCYAVMLYWSREYCFMLCCALSHNWCDIVIRTPSEWLPVIYNVLRCVALCCPPINCAVLCEIQEKINEETQKR